MENTISLPLGTIIDLVILGLLCATIFYALRLSGQLKILKQSKGELEQLVSNLAINITRAQEAIQEMHEVSDQSGEQLHSLIKQGRGLSDELQLITEAGDSLARRLENLAVGNRQQESPKVETQEVKSPQEKPALLKREEPQSFQEELKKADPVDAHREALASLERIRQQPPRPTSGGSFMIRDREFEDGDFAEEDEDYEARVDEEFEALTSRAERELASALKRRRRYDA